MGIVRQSGPAPYQPPTLANVAQANNVQMIMPVAMNPARSMFYGGSSDWELRSSADGKTWAKVRDVPGRVEGLVFLNDGEVVIGTYNSGASRGAVFRSTGWTTNPATATLTQVLTGKMASVAFGTRWGLRVAPEWSTRPNLVLATAYGGQTPAAATEERATAVYASTDHGATWHTIFDIMTWKGSWSAGQHMHGVAYDPWDDRVLVTFGDGNSGSGALTAILYSDDFDSPNPTWAPLTTPATSAVWQATGIHPTESGIIFGTDGMPTGLFRVARRGYRKYGPITVPTVYGGGTDTGFIGNHMYQASPTSPTLISLECTKAGKGNAALYASLGGSEFYEVWRDVASSNTGPYIGTSFVCGPLMDGTVVFRCLDYTQHSNGTLATGQLIWS